MPPARGTGHLVRGPSGTVWVAGGTGLYDELALLPAWAGAPVDVAVVPIAGWGPRLSAGHLGPDDAAVACRRVGARVAVPVHWNTLHAPGMRRWPVDWMAAPGPRFAAAVEREAPGCRVHLLDPGGAVTVAPGR